MRSREAKAQRSGHRTTERDFREPKSVREIQRAGGAEELPHKGVYELAGLTSHRTCLDPTLTAHKRLENWTVGLRPCVVHTGQKASLRPRSTDAHIPYIQWPVQ